jgi:hypothetical protein
MVRAIGAALLAFVTLFATVSAQGLTPNDIIPSADPVLAGYALDVRESVMYLDISEYKAYSRPDITSWTFDVTLHASETVAREHCQSRYLAWGRDGLVELRSGIGQGAFVGQTAPFAQTVRDEYAMYARQGRACVGVIQRAHRGATQPDEVERLVQEMVARAS